MFNSRNKLIAGGFALSLLATACGSDLPTGSNQSPNASGTQTVVIDGKEIELTSGLAQFDNCDSLLAHLRAEGAERVGPYGFNNGNYWDGPLIMEAEMAVEDVADMAMDASDDGAAAPTTTTAQSAGGDRLTAGEDYSGTNNQEVGVDEPDYVKTDGKRILTMTRGTFTYVDIDGDTPTRRGSIGLNHSTQDMLVVDDTAYLFGTSWGEEMFYDEPAINDAEADFVVEDFSAIHPGQFRGPTTQIIELDISNADSPTVVSTLHVEGQYLSARLIGTNLSVAVQSDQHDLGFLYPQGNKGEEAAEKANKEIVMQTEIDDWLPNYELDAGGNVTTGQLTDCANVHAPAEFAGFGSLSVFTFNGQDGLGAPGAASVLASGQNVYASTNSMWISTNQWYDWANFDDAAREEAENSYTTQIHGFSLDGTTPNYLASGSVRGHLLNQFAMSEHEGVLRVASTDGSQWGPGGDNSESFVTTLAIEDDGLRQLGQVGEMGKGEQIFAVRFVGDVGYVVTFRQTDPFYTVDLSDPANPEVLGELKITGFSGQLHPLGPDHVLGIGQEATNEGRTTGAKVTLFDVSDLANPIDVANWTVDDAWSDAQWDHKAFLWWPQENLAVLPVQNWSQQFFGAVAFHIDLEAGTVAEAGRLSHEPDESDKTGTTDCEVIDASAFEQFRGNGSELGMMAEEIQFMALEGQGQIQDCAPGQTGATGMYCESWDWFEMSDQDREDLSLDGTLEFCWLEGPGQDPIIRTIVIGDTLWSLSHSRLQANGLVSLDPGPFVSIG